MITGKLAWFAVAAGLIVVAYILRRWAQRHDLKSMATDAAWAAARKRGMPEGTELQKRIQAYSDEPSNAERARMATVDIGKHVVGRWLAILAWIIALSGFAIAFFAYLWG
ncbi:MAG TPA: hypothetical protein PK264_04960 [Hyphomicrobiaceae bacterium]|nr:hypothetical protein [Hyphomicrobiaceae bacterium]